MQQFDNFLKSLQINIAAFDGFFEIYRDNLTKNKYSPSNIFNVDETGLTTVQNPGKVVAPKGEKTVGKVTSAERGELITAICCMSASGTHLPPMFVFPIINIRVSIHTLVHYTRNLSINIHTFESMNGGYSRHGLDHHS